MTPPQTPTAQSLKGAPASSGSAVQSPSLARTISVAEMFNRVGGVDAVGILDVRTPGEYEGGHIPGAANVPVDQIGPYLSRLAQTERELVVVCQSGGRATTAHRRLAGAGARNTRVLTGGMAAWNTAGGSTETGHARWGMERQVRLVAGSSVLVGIVAGLIWPKARLLSAGIGAGLTFSAVSNTCGMGALLAKLPYNRGRAADIRRAVDRLLD